MEGFVVGLLIGGTIGCFTACLIHASKDYKE